uniref:Uncharacterized protein n=1 Tax=Ditylenchus dipsaci TaxID=166011 RepID=A0A915DWH5_9BILA
MASLLWNEWFWLPEGTTWLDLKSNGTFHYPQFYELSYSIVFANWILRGLDEPEREYFDKNNCSFEEQCLGGSNKDKFKRVAETAWRLTFYSTIWIVGMCVLWDQPQFWEVNELVSTGHSYSAHLYLM